ncbi:MAG: alpha/beta fold hydrolase [Candidatus Sulfotelmatobacter sp.]
MSGGALLKERPDNPSAETIETLTQIWQRVLQRSPIGPGEKFYALGGTDELADRTFAEIAQVFNRQLPTATICYAPTISALAAVLEEPTLPRFSPFVLLKAGSEHPPIFIGHGVGGRASFSELAKHIRTENPIYGIQARGVDGLEPPLGRIEDMAEYYLDALRELQPQDPYILIGYSFGGLIALEMAQRLLKSGKHVALLVMVDSYPDPRYLPLGDRVWLIAKKIKNHLSDLRRKPLRVALERALGAVRKRVGNANVRKPHKPAGNASSLSFAETTAHVKQFDFLAMRRYRPQFYPGKIKFVRPETNSYLPTDPTAFWKHLAAEFEVETVPGDHLGMIGKHFEKLAETLSGYVKAALSQEEKSN